MNIFLFAFTAQGYSIMSCYALSLIYIQQCIMNHVNISLMGICFKSCTYWVMIYCLHRSGYSLSGLYCMLLSQYTVPTEWISYHSRWTNRSWWPSRSWRTLGKTVNAHVHLGEHNNMIQLPQHSRRTRWPGGPGRPMAPGTPGSPWKGQKLTLDLTLFLWAFHAQNNAQRITDGSNTHIVSRPALFSRRTRSANFALKVWED